MDNLGKYINIIESICVHQNPGKKTIQKLFYLIERKGVKLDLDYRIHFFGPYSSKLDNALYLLQSYDFIDINIQGKTHVISVLNTNNMEYEGLSLDEQEIVDFVVNEFKDKSPLELEAMTTLDYVANFMGWEPILDDNKIIDEVIRIKGSKFTREELRGELEVLKKYDFIN